jgi:hypothetical protein
MPIDFRSTGVKFDASAGHTQKQVATVTFGSRIIKDSSGKLRVAAALNGFDVSFTGGEHPLHRQIIDISSIEPHKDGANRVDEKAADITVSYLLRDHSGRIDDVFEGVVDFMVVAEVA